MIMNYLKWFKNLELEVAQKPDAHLLMSSSVYQPIELLTKQLGLFQERDLSQILSIPDGWGYPPLIESISRRYKVEPQRITPTNGVSNAIYLLCRTLLSPGDHAVIESPAYEPLVASPDFIGCGLSFLNRRPPDYMIDPDEFKRALTRNTKLVIISNLHNPTGTLIPDSLLIELAEIARSVSSDIRIFVDEVYRDFESRTAKLAAALDDCFISSNSLTKVYGLGALHTGWIIASPELIEKIKLMQTLVEGSGAKLLSAVVAQVVESLDEFWDHSSTTMGVNRKILRRHLEPLLSDGILSGEIPEHGCIYFPKVAGFDDTSALVDSLAKDHDVYVVPGRFFGLPSHIRIGFGAKPTNLEKALKAFVEAMSRLPEE